MLTNFLDTGRNGSQCKGRRQTQVAVNTVGFRRQKWAPQILRFLPYTETSSHTVNLKADNSQSTPSPSNTKSKGSLGAEQSFLVSTENQSGNWVFEVQCHLLIRGMCISPHCCFFHCLKILEHMPLSRVN